MKRLAIVLVLLSLVAISCTRERVNVNRLVENYAQVTIPAPDLSGITDNGKEVLKLYRMAADEVDKIYWQQYYGNAESEDCYPYDQDQIHPSSAIIFRCGIQHFEYLFMQRICQYQYAEDRFNSVQDCFKLFDPFYIIYRFYIKRCGKSEYRNYGHRNVIRIPQHYGYVYIFIEKIEPADPEHKKQEHKNAYNQKPATDICIRYPDPYRESPQDQKYAIHSRG